MRRIETSQYLVGNTAGYARAKALVKLPRVRSGAIDAAFASLAQKRIDALMINPDPLYGVQIAALV